MALKPVIRKGDATSHGGVVLEGVDTYPVQGIAVACVGHLVSCPLCLGTYPIVEGVATFTIEGKQPAVDGMKTACGASLIASQSEYKIE